MSAKINADPEDVARIQGKLDEILPHVKAVVQEIAMEVQGKIQKAPPQPKGRKMHFKNMRQRQYMIAAIKEGLIDVPYRRAMSPGSESLSKSWSIHEIDDGMGAIVGNDTIYGPLLQDREKQSLFHKETGWITTQDVQEEYAPLIAGMFQRAVRKAIGG